MDTVDAVVIGAGVVGLAVARALALAGHETVVIEQAALIGSGTSSRNSEVLHAGIYYPSGSMKARLCAPGRRRLADYCESRGVAYRLCGKLLVATSAVQLARLTQIQAQAARNGVTDLQPLDAASARALEPALDALGALHSPSTGIVDSDGLMLALLGDLEANGGALALRSPLQSMICGDALHVLQIGGEAPSELAARIVVNAAGLWAPALATRFDGLAAAHIPSARYAKGNYFSLACKSPFTRLIYPIPEEAGLGVHLTLDLAGQARFGPDVEWIAPVDADAIDYRVDASRVAAFEAAIRRYWPGLPADVLQPAYSGVRPKLAGQPDGDFVVQGPAEHGVRGLVNLFGIESPGLTCCLALGDEVLSRLA